MPSAKNNTPVETYEESKNKFYKSIDSDVNDLAARIKGSSLKEEDKKHLIGEIVIKFPGLILNK